MNIYIYIHERVLNINVTTIMWDVLVFTVWTILANWPDIVLQIKKKTWLLIDIAIPDDSHINTKENEKLSKYNTKDLENKVSRMWQVRTEIVPVITGALGTIKTGLGKNLQLLPGQPSATDLQNIKLMSTAHIIRKVLWSLVGICTYQNTVT